MLRAQHIERAIRTLKGLVVLISLVAVTLLIREFLQSGISTTNSIGSLANEIDKVTAQKARGVGGARKEAARDYNVIVEKNVFGPIGAPPAAPTPVPVKPVTKIPLSLVGTFVSRDEPPSAIIEDQRKGLQDVFLINDLIFGEAKLVAVLKDSVEIERNGQRELLRMDSHLDQEGGETSSPTSGDDIAVNEAEVDAALGNLPLLLTQVRAVPYFKEGQPVGLRLFAIKPGSLFEKIGLKNGDILMSINGNSLGDFSQAMKLFERLKAERSLKVSLERNKELKEFRYQIR